MNIIIKKTISKVPIKKRVKSVYYTTFGPHTGRVSFKFDQSITRETASVNNTPDKDNSDKIPKIFKQTTIQFSKKKHTYLNKVSTVRQQIPPPKVHSYSNQISNVRQMAIEFPQKKVHCYSSQISNVRQLTVIVEKMDDPFFGCF